MSDEGICCPRVGNCCWFPFQPFEVRFEELKNRESFCCCCCMSCCFGLNKAANSTQKALTSCLYSVIDCLNCITCKSSRAERRTVQRTTVVGGSSTDQWIAFASDMNANGSSNDLACWPCYLAVALLILTGSITFNVVALVCCPCNSMCLCYGYCWTSKREKAEPNRTTTAPNVPKTVLPPVVTTQMIPVNYANAPPQHPQHLPPGWHAWTAPDGHTHALYHPVSPQVAATQMVPVNYANAPPQHPPQHLPPGGTVPGHTHAMYHPVPPPEVAAQMVPVNHANATPPPPPQHSPRIARLDSS
jgi:hypothetical protein